MTVGGGECALPPARTLSPLAESLFLTCRLGCSPCRAQIGELVWLVRQVEDPEDVRVESAEVLLSLLDARTMYLLFLHHYIAAQDEDRALQVLQRMPRAIISTFPLQPPASNAAPSPGAPPADARFSTYTP